MKFYLDGNLIFSDSVEAGTYNRSSIKLEGVRNGFHKFEIESERGRARYSKKIFIFLNRTVIFEYFKGGESSNLPYIRSRTMVKKFFPD